VSAPFALASDCPAGRREILLTIPPLALGDPSLAIAYALPVASTSCPFRRSDPPPSLIGRTSAADTAAAPSSNSRTGRSHRGSAPTALACPRRWSHKYTSNTRFGEILDSGDGASGRPPRST